MVQRQTGNSGTSNKGQRRLWFSLVLVAALALAAVSFWFDEPAKVWIKQHHNPVAKVLMLNITRYGDWPEHVVLGFLGAGIAWRCGNKKWTRIFVSMLLAVTLAGWVGRGIQITTGRARPSVEEAWEGQRLDSKYYAFPSGHTAASSAFFGVLLFVNWRLGLLCLSIPMIIGFSRMYFGAHHLSDVVCGLILGIASAFVATRLLPPEVNNQASEAKS